MGTDLMAKLFRLPNSAPEPDDHGHPTRAVDDQLPLELESAVTPAQARGLRAVVRRARRGQPLDRAGLMCAAQGAGLEEAELYEAITAARVRGLVRRRDRGLDKRPDIVVFTDLGRKRWLRL